MSTLAHTVARSVLLEAAPEQVWEAITDERALSEEAERLAFHWWRDGAGPSRVEFVVAPSPRGTRLTVIETGAAAPTVLASSWTASLGSLRLVLGRLVLA